MLAAKAVNHGRQGPVKRPSGEVFEFTGFAQLIRPWVKRHQVLQPDGPAGCRHIVARLKIDRVQRHAPPPPDGGAAAKASLPITMRSTVHALGGHFSLIELLHGVFGCHAARLRQQYLQPTAGQLQCRGDTRRAGSYDADIGLQRGTIGESGRIIDHRRCSSFPTGRKVRRNFLAAAVRPLAVTKGALGRRLVGCVQRIMPPRRPAGTILNLLLKGPQRLILSAALWITAVPATAASAYLLLQTLLSASLPPRTPTSRQLRFD